MFFFAGNTKQSDIPELLPLLMKRREAASFQAEDSSSSSLGQPKRAAVSLREECCQEGCYFEETEEVAEDHGWGHVRKLLCEYAVKEG